MRIQILKEHIEHSLRKDSGHCMIADAIKRQIPTAQFIVVDIQAIRWSDKATHKRHTCLTPPMAQYNLIRFDRGDHGIQPFAFDLVPQMTRATGWKGQRRSAAAERPTHTAYRKTGVARVVATKEREFGLRKLVIGKAE